MEGEAPEVGCRRRNAEPGRVELRTRQDFGRQALREIRSQAEVAGTTAIMRIEVDGDRSGSGSEPPPDFLQVLTMHEQIEILAGRKFRKPVEPPQADDAETIHSQECSKALHAYARVEEDPSRGPEPFRPVRKQ